MTGHRRREESRIEPADRDERRADPSDGSAATVAYSAVTQTGRPPPLRAGVAIVLFAAVVAILKPWSLTAPPPEPSAEAPAEASPVAAAPRTSATSALPSPTWRRPVDGCLASRVWLITTLERWREQHIATWRRLSPVTQAVGPLDPTIPVMDLRSEAVLRLGWCAPTDGFDVPHDPSVVTGWVKDGGRAVRLVDVSSSSLVGGATVAAAGGAGDLGLLADPPHGASRWPAGTYVFRHRASDGTEHWFAVAVEPRPPILP
jgi:hypothetical protein